ncbi:MAG: DNA methyltransferase [Roseovarius sp.]|nr:DNA methyltransferase [Roseovarius sp.]
MSHYLKSVMDCVFGEIHFRNELIWGYPPKGKPPKYGFHRKHDIILFYGKSKSGVFKHQYTDLNKEQKSKFSKTDGKGRKYKEFKGKRTYLDESNGRPVPSWWSDIGQTAQSRKEFNGYPTQKPLALLKRIIFASSNPKDIVLDPFCGCATTCVAAEQTGRQWMGIDISIKAYDLVRNRLTKEIADPDDILKHQNKIHLQTDPPRRTDIGVDYRERKFVYVISHPSYLGEYKVGIAKDWKSRLNAYQTSDPDRQYKIEYSKETSAFRETERHIHEKFPNKHEWVQGDLNEIIREIELFIPEKPVDLFD